MKKWLKTYLGFNQNILAWISVLMVAGTLFFVLFSHPRVGAADFGEYDLTLYRMGLSRMAADEADVENRYFTRIIEAYQIDGVDESRLFGTIPTESMIYPIALISAVCKLCHIPFDTVYLALFYCMMLLISVFILTKSLYGRMGNRALLLPVLLCVCVFHSDNIVPFNSLYSDGFVLTSFLFFLAMAVRAFAAESARGVWSIVKVFIAVWLFLTSNASMPYLVVVVLPFLVYLCCRNCTDKSKIRGYICASVIGCALILFGCIHFISDSETLNTQMNLHSATFNGAFVQAEDKKEALAYFGLSEKFQADIGKSYYLPESEYVVAPYSKKAQTELYSHITYSRLFQYYISHPSVFLRVLNQNLAVTGRADLERYLYIDRDGSSNPEIEVEKMGYYAFLRRMIAPLNTDVFLVFFSLAGLSMIAVWFCKWRKKERSLWCAVLLLLLFTCAGRLLLTTFLYGTFENRFQLFSYMMFWDICFAAFLCAVVHGICVFAAYLNEKESRDFLEEPSYTISVDGPVAFLRQKISQAAGWCDVHICQQPKWAVLTISALAAIVMFIVLFVPERIGAYNNGDFGRMMDAMGLYYTDYDLLHQDEQYVTKVIETYVWLDNFDWTSVTFLNPTMSQVFLAVLVKLTAGAMGFSYSTVYATVIYWILMTIGFAGIAYGLYRALGKKSLLLSGMLIVVLFGSYNLGWFNSLFSEATEMACFLLVLGMSLFLIVKERGTVRWYEWFFLMVSIRLFIGAKSQVTPEIMVLGIWALILAAYHRPQSQATEEEKKQKRRRNIRYAVQLSAVALMVFLTARSAVILFQKDSAISSQDTTYSAIFSGVLMVADDPKQALSELGLDESLVVDAGKNPYLGDGAYYCQPRTEMAEEMIYSKVNTFHILGWYLKHPDKLLHMLDHAAQESAARMPDYFLYSGEKTTQEHRTVSKFNLWSAVRGSITPNHFWQYVVLYGAIIIVCLRLIFKKSTTGQNRMLAAFMIVVVFAGAIQFPLSVIGNGFIDNTKQLFMFRLVHDIIITVTAFAVFVYLRRWMHTTKHEKMTFWYKIFQDRV